MSSVTEVPDRKLVYEQAVRCPDLKTAELMEARILKLKSDGDSAGGVIHCIVSGVPAGWGEPMYAKLSALLGSAMLSLPAVKGFEIGSGFGGTQFKGSEHNDSFYTDESGKIRTRTNHSGGIQGGISNGERIEFRVAFKPTSTINKLQQTINSSGEEVNLEAKGRHDPCVLPRAVPVVEAMAALVLADMALLSKVRRT